MTDNMIVFGELGIFSWYGYDLPFAERLTHIKQAGFKRISIWFGNEESIVKAKKHYLMCEAAHASDLHIESAHAPDVNGNEIWAFSSESQKNVIKELVFCIKICAANSIPILVMHVTSGENAPSPNKNGQKIIRDLVEMAETYNVTIAIENTRKDEPINYLLSSIENDRLGLCYDSSHDFLYSKEPGRLLENWGHRLKFTHFSDNSKNGDKHWIPGRGTIDWKKIKAKFPKDWGTSISLEVVQQYPQSEGINEFLLEVKKKGLWLQKELFGKERDITSR